MIHAIVALLATVSIPVAVQLPAPAPAYQYCFAQSSSPRGVGLIVSPVFAARANPNWVRQRFINFLRASYAPYGNNWRFREESAECTQFPEQAKARADRDTLILDQRRGGQNIYFVSFVS